MANRIKPARLFEMWRPDEVAECLEGVSTDIYKRLWTLVPRYDGKEVTARDGSWCLATWWDELSIDCQRELNRLAWVKERKDAEDMAKWRTT